MMFAHPKPFTCSTHRKTVYWTDAGIPYQWTAIGPDPVVRRSIQKAVDAPLADGVQVPEGYDVIKLNCSRQLS